MLDKMKEMGSQAVSKTGDAIGVITTTVSSGVDALASSASSGIGTMNEKAVRASASQMYRILEIALEELKHRPLSNEPISITSTVNLGIASLEMQIHLNQDKAVGPGVDGKPE